MLSYEGLFFDGEMLDIIHSLETHKLSIVNDEINTIQVVKKYLMK